jgi:phosphatidylethanolamine/phosphatidyl-N-methylethanolamine N-methyltransferase
MRSLDQEKKVKNASEKFYDRLSFLYPLIDLFLAPQKRKFFGMINSYPQGRLLEIGVGNGNHLKHYGSHDIIGIDTSENMLDHARKYERDNIQILKMNGEALLFPNEAFDYIILSHVIAVVEDPEKVLEEVYRVLKLGGKVFILNHFTPDNWLKYLDISVAGISKLFHFKSVFHITSLQKIEKFKLLNAFAADPFSYFKILIYEKNV